MSYYLACDYQDKPLKEIFEKSKELMKGYKAKAALVPCTFIGWSLLAIVPMIIATMVITGAKVIITLTSGNMVTTEVALWELCIVELFTLGSIFVNVYMAVTLVHFYEDFNPKECFNEDYVKPETDTKRYNLILGIVFGSFLAVTVLFTILIILSLPMLIV